ncbi:SusC/RagA family TonB-linked outer membrane protein [Membranihabitans marinus]|uniref:SusC/RagA family TonB-linked outer membrane protein n=1 Tax=Membranihabitans marinus TaxID=1227546 RepID=UPI001F3FB0AD|nr:TonB-dependent receptor [Membranihabitans marinus]
MGFFKRMYILTLVGILAGLCPGHSQEGLTLVSYPHMNFQERTGKQELKRVLYDLEKRYNVNFAYQAGLLDEKYITPLDLKELTLEDLLSNYLKKNQLDFKKMSEKNFVIYRMKNKGVHLRSVQMLPLRFNKFLSYKRSDRQPPIDGLVVDKRSVPLIGATVQVKEQPGLGAITDFEGRFSFGNVRASETLIISYIGYKTIEVPINGRSNLTITLEQNSELLDEVVIVGYGVQRKGSTTGAMSSVKAEEITKTPITNIAQGIQSRVSGVQITQNSSAPGGNISVRVRGTNSINGSSEPLYVIDGIQISNGGGVTDVSPLSTINPNDIESVEILKDASATAIYGARGANGVVLISTKRGKNAPTKIQFDSYVGMQKITKKLDVLNAKEFAKLENEIYPSTPYPDIDNLGQGSNWQNLIYRKAPIQNYQLSVTGGNEKTQFSVSGNYFDQSGIIIKSNFKRFSLRSTLDHNVNDRIRIGSTILGSYSANNGIPTGVTGVNNHLSDRSIVGAALGAPPTLKPYRDDGAIFPFVDQGGGRYAEVVNPLGLAEVYDKNQINRILTNQYFEIEILENVRYRATANFDINYSLKDFYSPIYIIPESMVNASSGTASKTNVSKRSLLHESILTYIKDFNEHGLKFTGVYSIQRDLYSSNSISASGFPNDQTTNEALGLGINRTVSSYRSKGDLVSVMGRLNYSFKSRYIFDLTARYDGASKFGINNKYGFFPAVAFGWRLIDETFMSNQNVFSDLKIRTSYGLTGNAAAIGPYQSLSLSSQGYPYIFNHQYTSGISPSGIANTDLRWEKSQQLNLGVDMSFINNRLNVVMDIYDKKTDDLLFGRDLPMSSGYNSYTGNFASIRNRGFEFAVDAILIDKELKWDLAGNISINKNELLSLEGKENEFILSEFSILKVGLPVGTFRTYVFDGIYQTGENILPGQTSRVGGTKLKDVNGDGMLTSEDQLISGDANPKIIYGVSSNLSFMGFDLSVFLSGVHGNSIYNLSRYTFENPLGSRNTLGGLVDRWSLDNPSNEFQNGSQGGRLQISDRFIEDGSYLRLKNVSMGYRLTSLKSIASLRIYISANNALTFTSYSGYDPEVNSYGGSNVLLGVDNLVYPNSKSLLFGLQIGF